MTIVTIYGLDMLTHSGGESVHQQELLSEHVVWKRMDGGNLSLPAVNARGMGSVPFCQEYSVPFSDSSDIGTAYETGEDIQTDSPLRQLTAQCSLSYRRELHQIAVQHPIELRMCFLYQMGYGC